MLFLDQAQVMSSQAVPIFAYASRSAKSIKPRHSHVSISLKTAHDGKLNYELEKPYFVFYKFTARRPQIPERSTALLQTYDLILPPADIGRPELASSASNRPPFITTAPQPQPKGWT